METVTSDKMYAILQEINHRLKMVETEIHELKQYPELRADYIEKSDEIEKQPAIHAGTVESLRNRYKQKQDVSAGH